MPSPTSVPDPAQLTVLYDGECRFCRWSVAQLLKLDSDKALVPMSIQSAAGQTLLAGVPADQHLTSAHCVDLSGRVTSGGAAFALVAELIPNIRWASRPAQLAPAVPDLGYRLIAGNRHVFSRWMTPARVAAADAVIASRTKVQ